jgi:hypothetical protein
MELAAVVAAAGVAVDYAAAWHLLALEAEFDEVSLGVSE